MFVYKNTVTGKEIRVPSRMGGKWVLVEPKDPEPVTAETPKPKKKRTAKKGE